MGMLAAIGGIIAIAAEQSGRSTFFTIVASVLENVLAMDLLSWHAAPKGLLGRQQQLGLPWARKKCRKEDFKAGSRRGFPMLLFPVMATIVRDVLVRN